MSTATGYDLLDDRVAPETVQPPGLERVYLRISILLIHSTHIQPVF